MRGRPHELTETKIDAIEHFILKGNAIKTSASAAGIRPASFFNYMNRGKAELSRIEKGEIRKPRKNEEIFVELLDRVTRAKAMAEVQKVEQLNDERLFRSAMDWLQRRNPQEWGIVSRENTKPDETTGALFAAKEAIKGSHGLPIVEE